jgi:hypothetical protein
MGNSGALKAEMTLDAKDATTTLQEVQRLSEAASMTLKEMTLRAKELSESMYVTSRGLKEHTKAQKDHRVELTESEKSARTFFQTQRVGDRMLREGLQTVSQLAMAYMFLTQSEGETDKKTKAVTTGLMGMFVTTQAAEYGFFSLGQAGKQLGGSLGGAMQKIAAFGGPLSILLGVIAGVVGYLHAANEETRRLEQLGTDTLLKGLTAAGGGSSRFLTGAIGSIEAQKSALAALSSAAAGGSPGGLVLGGPRPAGMPVSAAAVSTGQGTQANVDAVAKENTYRAETIEKIKKQIEEQEILVAVQQKVWAIVREQGTEYDKLKVDVEEYTFKINAGEANRQELIDKRAAAMEKIRAMDQTSYERSAQRVANDAVLVELGQKTTAELSKELAQLAEMAPNEKTRLAIRKQIYELAQKERDLERERTRLQSSAANKEAEGQLQLDAIISSTRIELITNEYDKQRAQEQALHQKNLGDIREAGSTSGEYLQMEQAIALENERTIQAQRQIGWQQDIAGVERVGAVLTSAFSRSGNEFIQKLGQALSIAIQIAKTVQLANAGKEGGGPLDILATIASIATLFDTGGYTGPGPRSQVAGLVHADEIVFEKPLVQRWGGELMSLRSNMQKGYAGGGYTGSGLAATGVGGPIVITGRLALDNGQIWLTSELPKAQRFIAEKRT